MTDHNGNTASPSKTKAIIGLILGITSVLMIIVSFGGITVASILGTILGFSALILGHITKKQFKEQAGAESQLLIAKAAFILGIIGTILGLLIFCAYTIIIQMALTGPAIEGLFQNILEQLNNQ